MSENINWRNIINFINIKMGNKFEPSSEDWNEAKTSIPFNTRYPSFRIINQKFRFYRCFQEGHLVWVYNNFFGELCIDLCNSCNGASYNTIIFLTRLIAKFNFLYPLFILLYDQIFKRKEEKKNLNKEIKDSFNSEIKNSFNNGK
jgi:hypothetical protein